MQHAGHVWHRVAGDESVSCRWLTEDKKHAQCVIVTDGIWRVACRASGASERSPGCYFESSIFARGLLMPRKGGFDYAVARCAHCGYSFVPTCEKLN